MAIASSCACADEQCSLVACDISSIGNERSGSVLRHVDLCTCRMCGASWLKFRLEDESSPGWNRWYRGFIDAEDVTGLEFGTALEILASLPWHFYGGAYYRSPGERSSGPVPDSALWLMQAAA